METMQRSVRDFHEKFGCCVNNAPVMVSDALLLTRTRLIIEEAAEFATAASQGDMVSMCDALADLLYVTLGTGCVLGVDLEPVFNEVHRSNMTKTKDKDRGHKVLKGSFYHPPDVSSVLQKQGWNKDDVV